MRTLAGAGSTVYFAHLSPSSCASMSERFLLDREHDERTEASNQREKNPAKQQLLANAEFRTESIQELMKIHRVPLERVCLLDPRAERELSPEDGPQFDWFLFGGILGDDPPRDRTSELRVLGFPNRHLGPVQMTTDTALGVTKRVVVDQVPLRSIPYTDHPTIQFNPRESVEMPFRYIAEGEGGEPCMPPGMRALLHEDLNKSFEF
ncbi:hypothetical protein BOTBODRAFT_33200 [Botryobasidium botryosum FD-172 SS1]|uniref:DUF431-domain-containing protein n=1 Tax=Botryobasidium botryosum (strain FD-172 SS1) TaxID=930990 RepID=A0A067MQ88_BOTB1|nr:hypothetical protein BOTBODRAFT_33200 [Botryobasidium botryosum FD-172 SS1]